MPSRRFFSSISSKAAQKVLWVLRLLVQLERVPVQYFCKMEGVDDIWECRIKYGSHIYRIFAFWNGDEIILTHGFIKKSQKTPRREVERAEAYRKDYWRAKAIDNR